MSFVHLNSVFFKIRSKFSSQFGSRFKFSTFPATVDRGKRNTEQFAEFGLGKYQFITQFLDCLRVSHTTLSYLFDCDINITLFVLGFNEDRGNIPPSKFITFLQRMRSLLSAFKKKSPITLSTPAYSAFESNYTSVFTHFSPHNWFSKLYV